MEKDKENLMYSAECLKEIKRLQHNQRREAQLSVAAVLLFVTLLVVAYRMLQ
jgi:preprotein translocase subunit SecE